MKAINQHLGLPVIALDTSERVGDLIRFVTDQVSGRIIAVAVSRKWYAEPAGVPFADCTAFGQNVVLVNRVDALKPLSQMDDVGLHLEASNDARQRTAITESGRLLGTITDEGFDEETGDVCAYRLDLFGETGRGRSVFVSHSAFVTSSATVAILRDDVLKSAAASLEALGTAGASANKPETDTDLRAPVAEAAPAVSVVDTSPETSSTETKPVASETGANPEPVAEEPITSVPASALAVEEEEPAGTAPETSSPEALEAQERVMTVLSLGKTAAKTVTADDGTVIVEAGQTISDDVTDAARASGKLYDVWISAQG